MRISGVFASRSSRHTDSEPRALTYRGPLADAASFFL